MNSRLLLVYVGCWAAVAAACGGVSHRTNWKPGETAFGEATYYAAKFTGRTTANGEVYTPYALTAASRDMPFGSVVRVTNLNNGKAVVVRINDRGPFGHEERILDLSGRAADLLEMKRAGVVPIRAEILELGTRL